MPPLQLFVIRVDSVFLRAGWTDYLVVNIGLLGGMVSIQARNVILLS